MRVTACVAIAAFLLASGGAIAEEKTGDVAAIPQGKAAEAPDAEAFAREASLAGLFDVETAQLALDRANDADVRKLAREIVEEQTLANSRLRAFAPKYARTKLEGDYLARLERLKQVKADAFDQAFLAIQKESHDRSVRLFQSYAAGGGDEMLKSYASESLSFLTLHQTRVNSLR